MDKKQPPSRSRSTRCNSRKLCAALSKRVHTSQAKSLTSTKVFLKNVRRSLGRALQVPVEPSGSLRSKAP